MKARKGRIARRAGPRCSVVELLEDRALLSAMVLSTSAHLAPPDGSRGASEVGSGAIIQDEGRLTTAATGGNDSVNAPGPDNNNNQVNVNFQAPPSVGRDDSVSITRAKATQPHIVETENLANIIEENAASQSATIQPLAKSVRLTEDMTTPSLIAADGGFSGVGEDLRIGGGDGLDSQDVVNLLGWAISTPSGGGSSSPDRTGPVISLTGRTADAPGVFSPATAAPGLVNTYILGVEHPGRAIPESRTRPESPHEGSVPDPQRETGTGKEAWAPGRAELLDGAASLDEETRAPGRAEPLDGAASFDWEMLDRDLRQFLSRFGGLQTTPDGRGGGAEWPLWLAVLTALFVAREAARGEGRWLRRFAPGAGPAGTAPARSPGPPGPWPLGLP